jgi:hypothetical protein
MLPLVLVILGVVALLGGLFYLNYLHEKKRSEDLGKFANSLGLSFHAADDENKLESLSDLPLFQHGDSQRLWNRLAGRYERVDIEVFDYCYTTGSGKSRQTHTLTVLFFPDTDLPDFALAPETFWDQFAEWFGGQDINFDRFPKFSKDYRLKSPEEAKIREVFGGEVLRFFEKDATWYVELVKKRLLVYRAGVRVEVPALTAFIDECVKLRAVLLGQE